MTFEQVLELLAAISLILGKLIHYQELRKEGHPPAEAMRALPFRKPKRKDDHAQS